MKSLQSNIHFVQGGKPNISSLEFVSPVTTAIESSGHIYVSDQNTNTIQKVSAR